MSSAPSRSPHPTSASWGLVLSGGAAYGIANAGVVTVLEREGLRPDCIAGSSMGAIVGALYAFTGSAAAFPELLSTLRLGNVARLSERPFTGGLHGGLLRQRLEELLGPVFGSARIGDCAIPFVCLAGEVQEPIDWTRIALPGFTAHVRARVTPHAFPPETKILDAITASSAIPVVFSPVLIGGRTFVDLVHFGAIPARTLASQYHPDRIIATDTNPRYIRLLKALPKPWADFLRAGYAELEESRAACDLVIEPRMPAALWRFDRARDFVDAGIAATEEALPRVRGLLEFRI